VKKNQEKSTLIFKCLVFANPYGSSFTITEWQGYNSTSSLGDAKKRTNSLLRSHVKVEIANMIRISVLKTHCQWV
jgi:hypothetical protein